MLMKGLIEKNVGLRFRRSLSVYPLWLLMVVCLISCGGGSSGGGNGDTGIEVVDSGGSGNAVQDDEQPGVDEVENDDLVSEPVDYSSAFRLLRQATFGPVEEDIEMVMNQGGEAWLDSQLDMKSAYDSSVDDRLTHLERLVELASTAEPGGNWFPDNSSNDSGSNYFSGRAAGWRTGVYQMSVWFENALDAPDQLRQRVAYALSQIFVTSMVDSQLGSNAEALAFYYDILARNALGNFRALMSEVALSPAMGIFLSHQGNEKASEDGQSLPDENFARELMQLFTIGLYELNINGTPRHDNKGQLIPTYNQQDIEEMAKVMTGWDLRYNSAYGRNIGSYVDFMEFNSDHHQFESKQIMGRVIADDGAGGDLEAALDMLFEHPNVGPFIGKQLIQRLVSSNPSPEYIERVARVFNDNGQGVRGDLRAVVRAILLDDEARFAVDDAAGKVQEPVLLYTAFLRAFDVAPLDGWKMSMETGRSPVNHSYYFYKIEDTLGQGALRANSVFNFYDPDFVPQDSFYRNSDPQRVLPEMQLRTAGSIASIFEVSRLNWFVLERNEIIRKWGSVEAYVAERNSKNDGNGNWSWTRSLVLLDYSSALQVFERAIDGDSNGDYLLINDATEDENGETPKQRGLYALLDFLEMRLLGGELLSSATREQLVAYLDRDSWFNTSSSQPEQEAIRVTAGAIQYVLTSATNMTQH